MILLILMRGEHFDKFDQKILSHAPPIIGRRAHVVYRRNLLREPVARGASDARGDFLAAQQLLGLYRAQNDRSNAAKGQPDVSDPPVLCAGASGKADL